MLVLLMAFTFIVLSAGALAGENRSSEAKITRAMEAAPDSITENATISDTDGTVLRQGTNGWTCLPASAAGAHPMCNDEVWMRLMKAVSPTSPIRPGICQFSRFLAG